VNLCSQASSFVQEIRGTGSGRCRDNQGFRKNRRRLQFGHIAQVVSRPKGDRYYQGKDRRQEQGHHRRVSLEKELQHDEFQQLFIERLGDSPPGSRSVTARRRGEKEKRDPKTCDNECA
jgi:hypothetical protein